MFINDALFIICLVTEKNLSRLQDYIKYQMKIDEIKLHEWETRVKKSASMT